MYSIIEAAQANKLSSQKVYGTTPPTKAEKMSVVS